MSGYVILLAIRKIDFTTASQLILLVVKQCSQVKAFECNCRQSLQYDTYLELEWPVKISVAQYIFCQGHGAEIKFVMGDTKNIIPN